MIGMKNTEKRETGLVTGAPAYTVTLKVRRKGGWWRREVELLETYNIEHPTLAVLDLMSRYWVDMEIPKEIETMDEVNSMAGKARDMARIVAIAIKGEECFKAKRHGGYTVDEEGIERFSETVAHSLKPSQLLEVAKAVTSLCDFGNFINSMRLMHGSRTMQKRESIE